MLNADTQSELVETVRLVAVVVAGTGVALLLTAVLYRLWYACLERRARDEISASKSH